MIELPMNTWLVQAPYDQTPRLRYMNPAVHSHLFANALKNWENECKFLPADLAIWVMIFHPDEVLAARGNDSLYARSSEVLAGNLVALTDTLRRMGHELEWMTVSDASESWKRNLQRRIA